MSRLRQIVVAALGLLATALSIALAVVARQRDNARQRADDEGRRADTAEERIEQRHKADTASAKGKEEGERDVEKARADARSGRRDHFADGWMRDD
ncbi:MULTISPECIES: hypothetical protein [Halomonas]|uniref:Uncharacterized protein n=1 Tax=Halomonas salipaludis TaxID=2032625 RepID=A0A2A2F3P6_9GAMM|nr:hypothetical protein [Halomonas salipaludis]PAU79232.1 hypothetical protein CK498_02355 [Halomonas salipaludis]